MLRRRVAQAAGRWGQALLPAAERGAGSALGNGVGSAVQQSLEAAGRMRPGSGTALQRWQHTLGAAGKRRAAGAPLQQQQGTAASAANAWRVTSWQQVRRQWSDRKCVKLQGGML